MNIKRKITSRKFWAAMAGIIVGVVMSLGGDGDTINSIAGTVMSVVSAVTYIIAEASIDKAGAKSNASEVKCNEANH